MKTMKHCGTQIIETERLLLRRFSKDDAEAMYRNWASDPEVTKYLTWPAHISVNVSRAVLEDWAASYSQENYYHQGIMSEALKAVMDYFFDKVGANRIETRHDPRNPHSGMVMKKCGMKYEGTMRESDRNNQGICDACWYALLRSER